MKFLLTILLLCTFLAAGFAADKSTSLSDVQSAIEANLKTSEGKAFDDRLGNDFVQNHMAPLRACKASSGNDQTSFWILLKLGKDGNVEELLFHPTTKLASCAHAGLMKEKFLRPPRSDYWVGVYMKVSR